MSLRLRLRRWACAIVVCFLLCYLVTYLWRDFQETPDSGVQVPVAGEFIEKLKWRNESYCGWRIGLPEKLEYSPSIVAESVELGEYDVIYHAVAGERGVGVTYCTHATPEYVRYVAELLRSWGGSISLAAFVPGKDFSTFLRELARICHCIPEAKRLSVHLVFPRNLPPLQEEDLDATCSFSQVETAKTVRSTLGLSYPVNVCRNAARHASKTSHVLVSDVELIPSQDLSERFSYFMSHKHPEPSLPHVWVIPVFELEPTAIQMPRTKPELLQLVSIEQAGYFHRRECAHCQRFPGLVRWLRAADPGPRLRPFLSTRRHFPFHRWEPIYIGTDAEPLYSEALTWEGRQDKMTQMLEMCLIGYRLIILDGGFLVHWPSKHKTSVLDESKHRKDNSRNYHRIVSNLVRKYPTNDACRP